MSTNRVHPDSWWELNRNDTTAIICGECFNDDLEKTASGYFTGDEAVTLNMAHQLLDADTEPYQCDGCLKQNSAYDEVDD